MSVARFSLALFAVLVAASSAHAHYPWIKIDPAGGKQGTVQFFFEHGPKPGDGAYLDPFVERGQFWLASTGDEAKQIELQDTKEGKLRWLQAELAAPAPRGIDLYTKWGVYRYGQTDTLLHYYARIRWTWANCPSRRT